MSEQFKIIENKKMSEKNEIITGSLYQIALREVTNNELQQIDSDFYMSISDFIGKISSSTMPHKNNPENCERVITLFKLVKTFTSLSFDGLIRDCQLFIILIVFPLLILF